MSIEQTIRQALERFSERGRLSELDQQWRLENAFTQDYSYAFLDDGTGEAIKNNPVVGGTDHDKLLREVASYSMDDRAAALKSHSVRDKRGRVSGSFASAFVIPDAEHPEESKVLLLERQRGIGAGYGSPGGLLDRDGDGATPEREWQEELEELIHADDTETHTALHNILKPEFFQPLFSCRDDSHVIERGWGKCVDAHAFVLLVPEELQQQTAKLFDTLSTSRKSGLETKGCKLISLKDLPETLTNFHYGHEAFGSIVGAQVSLMKAGIAPNQYNVIDQISQKDLTFIADKMRLNTDALRALYANVTKAYGEERLPRPGRYPEHCPTDMQYVNYNKSNTIDADSAENQGTIVSLAEKRKDRGTTH